MHDGLICSIWARVTVIKLTSNCIRYPLHCRDQFYLKAPFLTRSHTSLNKREFNWLLQSVAKVA